MCERAFAGAEVSTDSVVFSLVGGDVVRRAGEEVYVELLVRSRRGGHVWDETILFRDMV